MVWSRSRLGLIAGVAIFVGALAALLLTGHDSIQPSADSDETISVWSAVVPALAAIILIGLLPMRAPTLAIRTIGDSSKQLRWLIGIAVGFPLVWYAFALAGVDRETVGGLWALSKPIAFLLLPWLVLRTVLFQTVPGESLWLPKGRWRWIAPIPALLAFGYLALLSPLAGSLPKAADYPDPVVLAIGASLTFLTANVLEELFYRVMLQTRLEQAVGRWPAIVLTALLFALMHLPSHGQGGLPLTLGAIVVFQGTFGLFTGYLWSRYRNVWANIGAHTIINTLPLLLMQ